MSAEEQPRNPQQSRSRKEVRSRIISLAMVVIAALCAVFGYKQSLEAKAQRDEVIKLHREIKRLTEQSEAARVEAMKLRALVENERKRAETALQSVQSKSKK